MPGRTDSLRAINTDSQQIERLGKMLQGLVDKLSEAFKHFKNKGRLTEGDVRAGMREIKLALLEADEDYRQGRPFYQFVLTTSNHRPFTYPDGKVSIPSGTGGWNIFPALSSPC